MLVLGFLLVKWRSWCLSSGRSETNDHSHVEA